MTPKPPISINVAKVKQSKRILVTPPVLPTSNSVVTSMVESAMKDIIYLTPTTSDAIDHLVTRWMRKQGCHAKDARKAVHEAVVAYGVAALEGILSP